MVSGSNDPEALHRPAFPDLDGVEVVQMVRRGQGAVLWSGRDERSGQAVLVKTFEPSPDDQDRLVDVGKRLVDLDDPGVVRLMACRTDTPTVAWVMPVVDGVSLERYLAETDSPPGEAALRKLLVALLEGMDAVHAAGLIHRDIKPANIMLREDGTPVLVDFDAASLIGREGPADETSLLTPGYAAPEQAVVGAEEGPWTDIYGLAAVAYRIIAGVAPPPALARLEGDRMTPAVTAGAGRFSDAILSSVDRALRVDPAARPTSARAWRSVLVSDMPGSTIAAGDASQEAGWIDAEDDGPPTVRIRRRLTPPVPRRGLPGMETTTDETSPRKRRRFPVRVLAVVAAIAVIVGIGGWQGHAYYQSEFKTAWTVDASGGGDTRSIADALARARPDAVISVRPGTYAESLVLEKPQRLQGDGDVGSIVVLGAGSAPCLHVSANGATVAGLTLRGGVSGGGEPAPCLLVTAREAEIESIVVSSVTGPAVQVTGDAAPRIAGAVVSAGPAPGLLIDGSAKPTIGDSVVTGADAPAIVIEDSAAPDIAGNRISGGEQAGVLVAGGAPGVRDNDISGMALSGIEVRNAATPTLTGNRIQQAGEAGIYVHGAAGIVQGNVVVGSGFSGVIIGEDGIPEVLENQIEGSQEHGVLVLSGAGGRVGGNTITGNRGYGIARDARAETAFAENDLSENLAPQRRAGDLVFGDEPEYIDDPEEEASATGGAPAMGSAPPAGIEPVEAETGR